MKLSEIHALNERCDALVEEYRSTDDTTRLTAIETEVGELRQRIRNGLALAATNDRQRSGLSRYDIDGRSASDPTTAPHGEWLANELRTITGASGLGAATTPQEDKPNVLDFLAASSVFLASGVQQVRTDRDKVVFPHLTSDAASGWYAAGATISATDSGGESINAIPEKFAALTAIHNEVIADSNPAVLDTVAKSLVRSLSLKYDLGAFEGSGTTPEPTGLKNVSGIQSVSMGTNGAAFTNLDPFADAIGALEQENATATAIVMSPRSWKALSKLKEATGSNKPVLQESAGSAGARITRSIYGVPVFLSSQLSVTETQGSASNASSAYVYDASQVYAVLRQDVSVELDRSRLFNEDKSEVRAIGRGTIVVPNPKAVARIVGIIP